MAFMIMILETGNVVYEESGKYTIKDDKIEFTFESGVVQTADFSRSGNKMTLGGGAQWGGNLTRK